MEPMLILCIKVVLQLYASYFSILNGWSTFEKLEVGRGGGFNPEGESICLY